MRSLFAAKPILESDPFTQQAEKEADQNAAEQCPNGQIHRVAEFQIQYHCGVWSSYLSVTAQAVYECREHAI
jgi:hypothetical protein